MTKEQKQQIDGLLEITRLTIHDLNPDINLNEGLSDEDAEVIIEKLRQREGNN